MNDEFLVTGCRRLMLIFVLCFWGLITLAAFKACQPPPRELVDCQAYNFDERRTFRVAADDLAEASPDDFIWVDGRRFYFRAARFHSCVPVEIPQ